MEGSIAPRGSQNPKGGVYRGLHGTQGTPKPKGGVIEGYVVPKEPQNPKGGGLTLPRGGDEGTPRTRQEPIGAGHSPPKPKLPGVLKLGGVTGDPQILTGGTPTFWGTPFFAFSPPPPHFRHDQPASVGGQRRRHPAGHRPGHPAAARAGSRHRGGAGGPP